MASLATLMQEARRLDIRVHLAHFDDDRIGVYDMPHQRVVVALGLTMPETLEVLAHELSHAYFRHPCSTGRNERQADRRGAFLLVNRDDYARAERLHSHPASIAEELGLTVKVVEDYQQYWMS